MKAELFLVTYGPDFEFTEYTLRSIHKFGTGFSGITIVVPFQDDAKFKSLATKYGCNVRSFYEASGKGFLHHQVCKCEADIWCPKGVDLIVHIDADCIFERPFSLDTFLHKGKPVLVREHFEDFKHYPARYSWKHCAEYALGFPIEWETMVRHPSVFHADMYSRMRKHIEQRHKYPFTQYVVLQRNEFPQTFAEFPTLGAFALHDSPNEYQIVTRVYTPGPYWQDESWRKYGIAPLPRDAQGKPIGSFDPKSLWHDEDGIAERELVSPIRYFWSKRGVTPEYRNQIEALLA